MRRGFDPKHAIALFTASALMSCVSCYSIRVSTDADPDFDFSSVQTYAWLPDPPGLDGDPELHNELIDRRVRRVVNRELDGLGYELAAVDEADIHVTYYLGIETRIQWRVVSNTYQYNRAGWVEHDQTEFFRREYERGTLLLRLGLSRGPGWRTPAGL